MLLGRAVRLHPLAVVFAIAAGLITAGIAGALLAVPLLDVLNASIRSLLHEEHTEPETIDVLHDDETATNPTPEGPEDTNATRSP